MKWFFRLMDALKPDELQLGFLKVLYGSEMASNVELYEIEKTPYPPYEVLSTKWLSFDHILELKMVEEALEIFYNSRQFECTILYLQQFFETPYEMFRALGDQYQIHFPVFENHSRMKRYEFLLACSKLLSNDINDEVLI